MARVLTPAITSIINLSLQPGIFPRAFMHGTVLLLLKKPGLDKEILSNYRPITNFSFVSKVLERIVSKELDYTSQPKHIVIITVSLSCSSFH